MHVIVNRLRIEQKRVRERQYLLKRVPRNASAGVESGIDPLSFQSLQKLGAKIRLNETLSARKRDSATRTQVKILVLKQLGDKVDDRDLSAVQYPRFAETIVCRKALL